MATLLGIAAIIAVALWMVSGPRDLFMDFRQTYHRGALAAAQGPETFSSTMIPRIGNPPVLFWILAPFEAIPDPWRAGWLWLGLGIAASVAAVAVLKWLSPRPNVAPLLVALFLVNGPLMYSLREGNSSHFALLGLAGGLLLWERGFRASAGLVWGMCAVIKLPLLALAMLFVLKREWRVARVFCATVVGAFVVSTLLIGTDAMTRWGREMLLPFLNGGVAAYNAQSLDAFLLRLEHGAEYLREYDPVVRSTIHTIVRVAIGLPLLAVFTWALLRRRRGALDGLELSTTLALVFIMSPLAWSHYYTMLLLPFGLYVAGGLGLPDDRLTHRLMVAAIVLCSVPVLRSNIVLLHGPIGSRTLLSACFFGVALLMCALLRGMLGSATAGNRAA